MAKFSEPIASMGTRRTNTTLHGRSVHRPVNVTGHNVFKGYTEWANNGHVGVGDAVDLFADGGTEVYAIADGVQTRWRNDMTRLEVIYLEGADWLAVYAHIDAKYERTNQVVQQGEVVGRVRRDLGDPHVHFELWLGGQAVSATSSGALRDLMLNRMALNSGAPQEGRPRLIVAKPANGQSSIDGFLYNELPSRWNDAQNHIEVQTAALGAWLGKDASALPEFQPIREALDALNVGATFDLTHLGDAVDPRVYAFTT